MNLRLFKSYIRLFPPHAHAGHRGGKGCMAILLGYGDLALRGFMTRHKFGMEPVR